MSNPSSPNSLPIDPSKRSGQPGVVSDPDMPHRFGPDEPNQGEWDDTAGVMPPPPLLAPSPSAPANPLEDDDFAPDET